jgi:hypothetical protein
LQPIHLASPLRLNHPKPGSACCPAFS